MEAKLDGAKPEMVVEAVFPPGATGTDLYIDGGDVFIPVPASLGPAADGKERFAISFVSPAEAATIKGKTLALTLVSDLGSTETVAEGGLGAAWPRPVKPVWCRSPESRESSKWPLRSEIACPRLPSGS